MRQLRMDKDDLAGRELAKLRKQYETERSELAKRYQKERAALASGYLAAKDSVLGESDDSALADRLRRSASEATARMQEERARQRWEEVDTIARNALADLEAELLDAANGGAQSLVVAAFPHHALGDVYARWTHNHRDDSPCDAKVDPDWIHLDERLTPHEIPDVHPRLFELWDRLTELRLSVSMRDHDPLRHDSVRIVMRWT